MATYPGPVVGQFMVHLLDADGTPVAKAIRLPLCLAVASQVSSAWGKNHLAVASVNMTSGVLASSVCVSVLECR